MGDNCFYCNGLIKRECFEAGRSVPYIRDYNCMNYIIAQGDLKKLETGNLDSIRSDRKMLAQYLFDINDKRFLEVLA